MAATRTSLQAISALKCGPGNVLFDSGAIVAFELGEAHAPEGSTPFNVPGIDQKIADLVGAPVTEIVVKDMAIHPVTREPYIGVRQ